jgi:hypothetical protein
MEIQAKYFAWEGLVVVLLIVFVGCFYRGLESILQVSLDPLTSLFYSVERIYLFAGHQRLGGVNFRSGNSLVQPSKASIIFLLSFPAFFSYFQAFLLSKIII